MSLTSVQSKRFLVSSKFLAVAVLMTAVQTLGRAEAGEHWLKLHHKDYFHQILEFDWPQQAESSDILSAHITVTQPYEFRHRLTARAQRNGSKGTVEIHFPLIDDGRYAPSKPGSSRQLWDLGRYRFDVEVRDGDSPLGQRRLEVDPNTLSESYTPTIDGETGNRIDFLFILQPRAPASADEVLVVEIKKGYKSNGQLHSARDTEVQKFHSYVLVWCN